MRSVTKLYLTSFLIVYLITVAIFIIGLVFGGKTALLILLVTVLLVISGIVALLTGPIIKVRKLYSQRPPRSMYESISSNDGYCRIDDISKWFLLAVKCGEDHMFFNHRGISFDSLVSAVASDIFDKKAVGGSTITQQLIKNVYLSPEKSVNRKICEFLMVGRVEKELSKYEIFELYVNVINYGFGKYGITSAADFYYHCKPAELSFDQSLSLAAILPCPDKYNARANPAFFFQVRQNLLRKILTFSDLTFNQVAKMYGQNASKQL